MKVEEKNRSRIIEFVGAHGPTTRKIIAQRIGLAQTTVQRHACQLLKEGTLRASSRASVLEEEMLTLCKVIAEPKPFVPNLPPKPPELRWVKKSGSTEYETEEAQQNEWLDYWLPLWADWMRDKAGPMGNPKRVPGLASTGSSDFDAMADAAEVAMCESIDACIESLESGQKAAIYFAHSLATWEPRNVLEQMQLARTELWRLAKKRKIAN